MAAEASPSLVANLARLPGAVWRRSLRASVVVGTVLTALNHGDAIASGNYSAAWWWKIPLTYVVPFVVATYGALGSRTPAATTPPGGPS